jgi:hypothetical protein
MDDLRYFLHENGCPWNCGTCPAALVTLFALVVNCDSLLVPPVTMKRFGGWFDSLSTDGFFCIAVVFCHPPLRDLLVHWLILLSSQIEKQRCTATMCV